MTFTWVNIGNLFTQAKVSKMEASKMVHFKASLRLLPVRKEFAFSLVLEIAVL